MAIAHRTFQSGLLQAALVLSGACSIYPASAAINSTEAALPAAEAIAPAPVEPAPDIGWLEQPLPVHLETGLAATLATPTGLAASQTRHIGLQREDMDLTAGDSAISRYNLKDEEPFFSELWWQAVPGIAVALVIGLVMYMRHPIQRKRKYRSTPHEPTGRYARRHRPYS